ncbi:MAG: NAD(P)-dependent oxidoreductase [Planctomycetota bacterium]|nr:NAD(P)-dependent oxidoreductase [Planctomycetota bacterium]MDA1248672.1 NAD(P)-dependent oxidoreductase [Planctomycetota bacterium]
MIDLLNRFRRRLFGNASRKQVLLRVAVDLWVANLVLIVAAVLRIVVTGHLNLDNPVGQMISKFNAEYFLHAGWFGVWAVVLLALAGVYRPVPSSRIGRRFLTVTGACAVGFAMHVGITLVVLPERLSASVAVATPAWTLLAITIFGIRYSRMSVGQHYRVVPREKDESGKVEDVLIVGGAGYIGSVLTEQLLAKGYRVRILDMELFGRDSLKSMIKHPRLEFMNGDFRNIEDIVRALRDIDAVIHLAAIVGDPACALDNETTIAVNYAAAKMMSQLARANGISRVVFASTCSVYGESEEIRTEESDPRPVSLYATTKVDAERILLDADNGIFRPTILRFATAYGWSHRPRFDLVANLFAAQAVTENHIRVFNGDQWRPFIHTRDIARACVLAMEAPLSKVGGQIFNVGDHSQNFTLTQLGEIVGTAVPGTIVEAVSNDEDPRNYRVDFTKIQKVLGFRASVDLKDGIEEMVEAVRSGAISDWRDPVYSNLKTLQGDGLSALKFERPEAEELHATRRFLNRAA